MKALLRPTRAGWFLLAALFGARFLLAIPVFQDPARVLFPDSENYLVLARQLIAGQGYAHDSPAPADLARPPGYPLLLAGLLAIFGQDYRVIVLVQLALGAAVSMLLYAAASRLHWREIGFAAPLVYALTSNAALWAVTILSDTLFVFLVAGGLLLLAAFWRTEKIHVAAFSGIVVGLSSLTRPIGVVLLPLWGLAVAARAISPRVGIRRLRLWAPAFSVDGLVLVLPWSYKNAQLYGLLAVSSFDAWNLGRYQAAGALARAEGIPIEEARDRIGTSRIPQPGDHARCLGVIFKHPLDYLWIHAHRTWLTLSEAGQPNIALLLGQGYRGTGVLSAIREGEWGEAMARVRGLA
jgi:4-amino-4-deoxy-L-arabinose transferase-like glycosyltransferase